MGRRVPAGPIQPERGVAPHGDDEMSALPEAAEGAVGFQFLHDVIKRRFPGQASGDAQAFAAKLDALTITVSRSRHDSRIQAEPEIAQAIGRDILRMTHSSSGGRCSFSGIRASNSGFAESEAPSSKTRIWAGPR